MKILIINKSDSKGGAAVVSRRLLDALREQGADARMLVADRTVDSPFIARAAGKWAERVPFLAERMEIFARNGFSRDTLFRIDTGGRGLPLHRHPWVMEAGAVLVGWVNQGMLSLHEIGKIRAMGKKVVWTMHDMWNMTGICHHAHACRAFMRRCGNCPLLGRKAGLSDLSHRILLEKQALYESGGISFVAVSNWLAAKAARSTLLSAADVTVIPNAFPLHHGVPDRAALHSSADARYGAGRTRVLFGAARIDDPIKDFSTAVEAFRCLRDAGRGDDFELVTYGSVRDPHIFDGLPVRHRHAGVVRGEDALRDLYGECDIVLSTSSFETLPGTLVEGQAYGCIPVAFDSGGQADIVDHLSTGWLARRSGDISERGRAMADGLLWAASQKEGSGATAEKEDSGIRGAMRRHVAEVFSYPAVAEAYLRLISAP